MRSAELDDMADAGSEFARTIAHHLRDIRHLADFYRRNGLDAGVVADTLESAAADLLEWSCETNASPGAGGSDQKPVSIRA